MLSLSGTRLKSLTSNGTQWIQTNISVNDYLNIYCHCSVPNSNGKTNWIFGSGDGEYNFSFGKSQSNRFFANWGKRSVNFGSGCNTESEISAHLGRIDSYESATASVSTIKGEYEYITIFDPYEEDNYNYRFSISEPLCLFANSINGILECGTVTIYEIRHEGMDTTYVDLVPWMDCFGRVGMKDLISNQFFPGEGEAFEIEYFEEPGFLAEKDFWLNKLYTHRGIKKTQQRRNYNQLQKEFISFDARLITKAPDFESKVFDFYGDEYPMGVWHLSDLTLPFMRVVNSRLGSVEIDEWWQPSIIYHDDDIVLVNYWGLPLAYVYNPNTIFDLKLAVDIGLLGEITFPQKGLYYVGQQMDELSEEFQLSIYYKNGTSKLRQYTFDLKDFLKEPAGWLGDNHLYTLAKCRPKTAEVVCGAAYEYYQGEKSQYLWTVRHFDYGEFGWGKYPGYVSQVDLYYQYEDGDTRYLASLIISDSESELDGFYFDDSDEQIVIPGPGIYTTSPWGGDYVDEDWLNSLERGDIYWTLEWLSE